MIWIGLAMNYRQALLFLFAGACIANADDNPPSGAEGLKERSPLKIRVATINASLYGTSKNDVWRELNSGHSERANKLAGIVQSVRPDILLVNEIDYHPSHRCARKLADTYFTKPQKELEPLEFKYIFSAPVNTGLPSGLDIDRDGRTDGPGDGWGYGAYPGQYGMAVFSRFPIDAERIRTFQKFLWSSMPGALRPPGNFYSDQVWKQLRLSSKSHWDVPLMIGDQRLHVLASHPTPPVFDGEEDRNGRRNHDEIRFWHEYISAESTTTFVDDNGEDGSLAKSEAFVILGDLNADPIDGSGRADAIQSLLKHPRVQDPMPRSQGAVESANRQGLENLKHLANPATDTGEFFAKSVGNLRLDYVLPSRDLQVSRSGVFWPQRGEFGASWISVSDHRMVWVDIEFPGR